MTTLYEKDFHAWSLEQANILKKKDFEMLDFEHLVEEIETLGNSDKRALRSYLTIVLLHMLKIKFQPEKHTKSWDRSIVNSKMEIRITLQENPSLKRLLNNYLESSYETAKAEAEKETGIDFDKFPVKCPWTIEEIL